MKKVYLSFYALMLLINILPFVPMSIKGILGLVFIIISCMKLGYRDGMYTATLWIVLGFANFFLGVNVDYKYGIGSMLLGSLSYYAIAIFFGKASETQKARNEELKNEIKRRIVAEKELKENLTLLQSLMDTIPSPIFFKDLDCKYIGFNHAFLESIQSAGTDMPNKTVHQLYEPEYADTYNKMDLELIENAGTQVYETIVKYADGSIRNVIFNKALFSDENGEPIGIVGVMTDITDKRESEQLKQNIIEKKRIIDEIMEHDKMKTEFFSNVSHELRTPLNVILGAVQLMEIYTRDDALYRGSREKLVKNMAVMKQNCFRLLRLVNNLIDITRIDSNAFEVHPQNCNIVSIVEEITLSVSDYIQNKGISLVFDTDVEEKNTACDDEKIERIMLNLLSNAVKFTPEGGSIFVNIHDGGDSVSISVSDTGIGIPSEKQGELFKRFCQIDGMFTRQHEGSGIGLSLVKSLVEMHGGSISVKSEPHKGTTFTMDFPIRTVEQKDRYMPPAKQAHVERITIEFSDIYNVG